jgi:cytochrome P450
MTGQTQGVIPTLASVRNALVQAATLAKADATEALAQFDGMAATVDDLIEQQRRDADLIAVLLGYLSDAQSSMDRGRLATELLNRGLSDHDSKRRAILARAEGRTV